MKELNEVRRMGKQVTEPYGYQSNGYQSKTHNYKKPFLRQRRFQQPNCKRYQGGRNGQDFKKSADAKKYKNKMQYKK